MPTNSKVSISEEDATRTKKKEGIGDTESLLKLLEKEISIDMLSKTLASDLKPKKTSEEYWNMYSKEISKKISYHNDIDLKDKLAQRSNNTRVSTNIQNVSLKFNNDVKTKKTKSEKKMITRKIRIYPNKMQKELFAKYFGAHNYIYNRTVEEINKNYSLYIETKENYELSERILKSKYGKSFEELKQEYLLYKEAKKQNNQDQMPEFIYKNEFKFFKRYIKVRDARMAEINDITSEYSTRSRVVIKQKDLSDGEEWLKVIQSSSKQISTVKAFNARDSNLELIKNRRNKYFQLHFRTKKYSDNIFYIEKKALKDGGIFPAQLRKNNKTERYDFSKLITKKKDLKLVQKSEGEFSIKQEKDGKYYVCIVILPTDKILNPNNKICALDPGVRTFQTMFSEDSIGEYGFNTSEVINNLYRREDKLRSIIAKNVFIKRKKSKKRLNKKYKKYKLEKQCAKLRTKAKHIVQDLHWKTANHLTKEFQIILLPTFNTKNMSNKKKRKIRKTTARLMLGLSHYDFQQKLLYKANARGRQVILCKEHYTSKCCGQCGVLNQKLGSKKIFHCDSCELTMDRDIHAARNILIRGLTIYSNDVLSDMV